MWTGPLICGAYGAFIPPLDVIAQAAVEELEALPNDKIGPMHYTPLATLAWKRIGWDPPDEEHARQSAEHLRESANDGVHGLGYLSHKAVGKRSIDVGLIFLRDWIDEATHPRLFYDCDPVSGPLTAEACVEASTNVALRLPHIRDTFGHGSPVVARRSARGFLVEQHVSDYFKKTWPTLWRPASNQGEHRQASPDDFRLLLDGELKLVDVKRPNNDGRYQCVSGVPRANIYLLSEAAGTGWYLFGWCKRKEFASGIDRSRARPMPRLFVRLNCAVQGIDYRLMRHVATNA